MKRHEFEMIAAALSEAQQEFDGKDPSGTLKLCRSGVRVAAIKVADALARGSAPGGNRAFDRELFLRNAGVTES